MAKDAVAKSWTIKPRNDGKRWSAFQAGEPAASFPLTVDFTTASVEDPLSLGGTWTNNTQGTGSNTPMNKQSSMRIIAAASGGINIAAGDATGQSVPPAAADYMDSFAFVPGLSGNQRITATVYVDTGYSPAVDGHELELILGCVTATNGGNGTHKWIECGWSAVSGAGRFMAVFGTGLGDYPGAPNDFFVLSPTDSGALNRTLQNNDVWKAEYNRSSSTITTFLNGTQIQTVTDVTRFAGLGDGAGIACFRRTTNGQTAANKFGFKDVLIESF
jgi:hypothetical protein